MNWDALWDCICDLDWLAHGQVVVTHDDIPLIDPRERLIYLRILNQAIEYWRGRPEHELFVLFPRASKPAIRALEGTF